MPTNELAPEKRIADDLPVTDYPPIPDHPPIPSPETLEYPEPDEILGHPPQTRLLLDGFDPDEITVEFLAGIHGLGDEHGLPIESISVRHRDRDDR